MKGFSYITATAIVFVRRCVGVATIPYESYRHIVKKGSSAELLFVALVAAAYLAIASLVRTAAFRPYLLTRQFVILVSASLIGAVYTSLVLYGIGRLLGGNGAYRRFVVAWGYTLLPTVSWFLMTSLLYIVLPPPRTTSVKGFAFSFLYLVLSTALLLWKTTLVYLTLRFGLRLDLVRIITTVVVSLPFIGGFSLLMYRLGIFRIPFL